MLQCSSGSLSTLLLMRKSRTSFVYYSSTKFLRSKILWVMQDYSYQPYGDEVNHTGIDLRKFF